MKRNINGFTIVELILIIVIIGILATIAYVSYGSVTSKAKDTSVLSDLDTLDGLVTNYGLKNTLTDWYSNGDIIADLGFTPSDDNVIDIVVDGSEYCIRGYNLNGTKNSIFNAFIKESNIGVCDGTGPDGIDPDRIYPDGIDPSPQAIADYSGPKLWMKISPALRHTCAIASDYKAYCWGDNDYGQLGNNSTTDSHVPVAVDTSGVLSGKTIKAISTGGNGNTCAVASDNNAYCWGWNGQGQLGNNSTTDSHVPVAVDTSGVLSGKTIKAISTRSHTCAVASDNNAYCWGPNGTGELGNNSTTNSLVPIAVDTSGVLSGKTIKTISVGGDHACTIASDSNDYCWGDNYHGELGNNSTYDSHVPIAVYTSGVLSGKTIKAISTGSYDNCVIASDNNAYCWGWNNYGQLGNNSTTRSLVPVAVDTSEVLSGKTIKTISGGGNHICAIASNYNAYCWGYNYNGQLGNNSTTDSHVPVAVDTSGVLSGKTIKAISTRGSNTTCAITSNYGAYCWGYNYYGQLGNNSTTNSPIPVAVYAAP